jgi:hypothetical protein
MDEDEEGCKNGHDCACEAENLETRHVWNTVEYETHMNTQKWKFMEIRPWDWCWFTWTTSWWCHVMSAGQYKSLDPKFFTTYLHHIAEHPGPLPRIFFS